MTLKGAALLGLLVIAVLATAWARWRLAHGPIRTRRPGKGPERLP